MEVEVGRVVRFVGDVTRVCSRLEKGRKAEVELMCVLLTLLYLGTLLGDPCPPFSADQVHRSAITY